MNERKLLKRRNSKKENRGITLIALVISIIVMLILAGVSLNATIGENGIITKAQKAKLASEESKRREDLEYILYEYNSSSFLGQADGFTNYLDNLKTEGKIDDYLYTDTLIVKYDGVYYETEKNGEYYEIKNKLEDDLTGGSGEVAGGEGNNYIVTPDNLTSGNIEIAEGSSYVVLDEVEGEDFNFEIPAGEPVTIKIMGDMNIDNKGYKRSAIDLEEGATLNLYVYGKVEVNSGYGEDAVDATPGKGGYAGIHVPEGATLNLYGTGTITAIGGNAGSGPETYGKANIYTAGGGGAGAGIGGSGGDGGSGIGGNNDIDYRICESGYAGENCGNINIYNSLTVYAYGGAGGAGGNGGTINAAGSGGGGGYPAAGIGGGGAGGAGSTCCAGAGGYSGGSASGNPYIAQNGNAGGSYERVGSTGSQSAYKGQYTAGGYFEGGEGTSANGINKKTSTFGGFFGTGYLSKGHESGSGGDAGNGGTIKVSQLANVYAYNGNLYTDGTDYENGLNQCPIYAQNGIITPKYNATYTGGNSGKEYFLELISDVTSVEKSGYMNKKYVENNNKRYITKNKYLDNVDMAYQGVGSGAGYVETSNGTYTIDSSMN